MPRGPGAGSLLQMASNGSGNGAPWKQILSGIQLTLEEIRDLRRDLQEDRRKADEERRKADEERAKLAREASEERARLAREAAEEQQRLAREAAEERERLAQAAAEERARYERAAALRHREYIGTLKGIGVVGKWIAERLDRIDGRLEDISGKQDKQTDLLGEIARLLRVRGNGRGDGTGRRRR